MHGPRRGGSVSGVGGAADRGGLPPLPLRVVPGAGPERSGGARDVLFCIHGFPDEETTWDPVVQHFTARGFTCALPTLPLYGACAREGWPSCGLDAGVVVRLIADAIERASPARPVTLVLHDWGALYGFYLYAARPDLVRRIVTLDVGWKTYLGLGRPSMRDAVELVAAGLLYQYWLIFFWFLSQVPCGGHAVATVMFRVWAAYAGVFVHVCGSHWKQAKDLDPRMCYGYYHLHRCFWRDLLCGVPNHGGSLREETFPKVPTCYLYGTKKPIAFHSAAWLRMLRARPDCRVVRLDGTFHWGHWDEPARVNAAIEAFLAEC